MIRLSIGISANNIRYCYLPSYKAPCALETLEQHRIILNSNIIDYYEKNIPKEELEALSNFINAISTNEEQSACYPNINLKGQGIKELISQVKKDKMRTLVAEKTEIEGQQISSIEWLSIGNISQRDEAFTKSNLFLYSIPVTNHQVPREKNNSSIVSWFRNVFKGEKKIEIQDPYIFTETSLKILKEVLSPAFPGELSSLKIVGSLSKSGTTREKIVNEFSDKFYESWNVSLYNCPEFHSRCIQLDTLLISMDASLDFLGLTKTTKICRISISKDKAIELDNLSEL